MIFIILEIKKVIEDLIKSQNLIDVRTPSFLNVKILIKNGKNLVSFNERLNKIDIINNFFVQQLNKDFALVKISYFGKIKNYKKTRRTRYEFTKNTGRMVAQNYINESINF